jgi:pyridinium-3,5-biscarboxylic acid mononucleotide sulfurtransferase
MAGAAHGGQAVTGLPGLAFPLRDEDRLENLRRVGAAEQVLRKLGFTQVRVRHHGAIARLEIEPGRFPAFMKKDVREHAVRALKKLGWKYVALDLDGYRTGSLNEVLKKR